MILVTLEHCFLKLPHDVDRYVVKADRYASLAMTLELANWHEDSDEGATLRAIELANRFEAAVRLAVEKESGVVPFSMEYPHTWMGGPNR